MRTMGVRRLGTAVLLLLVGGVCAEGLLEVSMGRLTELQLNFSTPTEFLLQNIPANVSVIIFQVHSQYVNVTLSFTKIPGRNDSAVSSDAGVVSVLSPGQIRCTWYVETASPNLVLASALSIPYTERDPIPGACNQEFDLEIDPNIYLQYNLYETVIKFAPANLGYARNATAGECDTQTGQNTRWRLQYDVYQYFLPENNLSEATVISHLLRMSTVSQVSTNGKKLTTLTSSDRSTMSFSSIPGQGIIYNVIVRDPFLNTSAAYVPVHTYACNFTSAMDNCYTLVKMLKCKWKSFRDAYTRQLKAQRERRSGSAACASKEYIHSKELEFLRPVLALGSTENCWEEAAPTEPENCDNDSLASGDQAIAVQEAESQASSRSNTATPIGEDEPASTVLTRAPPRGIRRKAPASDAALDRMLDIMSNMSDTMNSRSYGQKSAKWLGDLMDKVPPNLQTVMFASTIRYIATFIPPNEADQISEPPPPYGPYANQPTQHLSAPPVPLWTAPHFPTHPPRPTPPPSAYPPLTTTHSHFPYLPTKPSTHTPLNTTTQPCAYPPPTTTLSSFPHLPTPPSTYTTMTPTTLPAYPHLQTPPFTYPMTTTTNSSTYPHLQRQPTYNPPPTPTPPPPPPSRWPTDDTPTSSWSQFGQAMHVVRSPHGEEDSPQTYHDI